MLSRYRGKTKCKVPATANVLRVEANYVKINGATITDLVEMPLDKLAIFFKQLELNDYDTQIAK